MPRLLAVLAVSTLALGLVAGCGGGDSEPLPEAVPAPPQRAQLDWEETYGKPGERVVFGVRELEVVPDGWRAEISITNDTDVQYAVGDPEASLDRRFGLMLFPTGDLRELEQRNRAGELPEIRTAEDYEPPLPLVLEPGATWAGTISARGSLPAGLWARVVFGALVPVGEAPEGLPDVLVWITDHAHQLERTPEA
jgi:hypothetical protein